MINQINFLQKFPQVRLAFFLFLKLCAISTYASGLHEFDYENFSPTNSVDNTVFSSPVIVSYTFGPDFGTVMNASEIRGYLIRVITGENSSGIYGTGSVSVTLNNITYSSTTFTKKSPFYLNQYYSDISIPDADIRALVDGTTYNMNINYVDGSGTSATTSVFTFQFQISPPVVSTVNIKSNGSSATVAKIKDEIELSFSTSKTVNTPTVTIGGSSATVVNVSGNNWKATIKAYSCLAASNIPVPFTIDCSDPYDNPATRKTTTDDGSSVSINRVAPYTIDFEDISPLIVPSGFLASNGNGSGGSAGAIVNNPGNGFTSNTYKAYTVGTHYLDAGTGSFGLSFVRVRLEPNTKYRFGFDIAYLGDYRADPQFIGKIVTSQTGGTVIAQTTQASIPTTKTSYSFDYLNSTTAQEGYFNISTLRGTCCVVLNGNNYPFSTLVDNLTVTQECLAPSNQASSISFSSVTGNSVAINFNAASGSPSGYLVVRSTSATAPTAPTNGTAYAVGSTFGSGATAATVVSSGSTTSVTASGLSGSTLYYFYVYSYNNTDCFGGPMYKTTSPLTSSQRTFDNAPTIIGANSTKITGTTIANRAVNIKLSDGTSLGTVTSTGTGSFELTYSTLSQGTTLTANTEDGSGNITSALSSIIVDATSPTLSSVIIHSNNTNPEKAKVGDIITVFITASEAIQLPTVTIAGQSATVTGTIGTYTATYTVTNTPSEGLAAISVTYFDLAGNAGTAVSATTNSSTVTIDYTAPSGYSFGINQASVTQANQISTSISLTAAEVGTTYNYTVSTGSGTITETGTITSTSQTISPINVSSLGDGQLTYSVTLTDGSGNTGSIVTQTVSKDAVVPTVSSVSASLANGNYKAGQVIPILVTFSEPVNVTGSPQLTLETGTTDAVLTYASGSGTTTLTFNYTVAAGENSTDLNYVSTSALALNSGTIIDLGGNPATLTLPVLNASNSLGGTSAIVVDSNTPTLLSATIQSNNSSITSKAKVGDVITVALTASEAIQLPTVRIAGGTVSTTGSGGTYSATYTVTSSTATGTVAFSIDFVDLAGNTGTQVVATTNSSAVNVDREDPVITSISTSFGTNLNSTEAAASQTITVTTTGVEDGEILSIALGSITPLFDATVTNNVASYTISSSTLNALTGDFTIDANVFDEVGNMAQTLTTSYTVDRTAPTLSSVLISSNNTNNAKAKEGDVITLSLTASEAINTPVVTIAGETATITGSGGTYTATYTVTSSTAQGTASLSVTFTDVAGNSGTAVSATTNSSTVVVDRSVPTLSFVVISSNNANPAKAKEGDVITVALTASESIQAPNVTIAGQSATVTGTGGTYTATYTVTNTTPEGNASILVNYQDLAGNAGTAVSATTNSSAVTVDKSTPSLGSVLVTSSNANSALAKIGDIITLSITASESITTPSISIAGGTVSITGSGGTYTATYTVTSSTPEGTASITISYSDLTGNAGTAVSATTDNSTVTIDRTAPTISVASNPANLRSGQTSVITFTVSESVSDFVQSDVSVSGGTLANWSAVSGTSYTAEFTPTANSNADGLIDVATSKFTDAAGNTNTAASSTVTISIDNTLPTVAITSSTTAVKAGETATITFTFSEAVLGFDLTDVTMNNGTFGTLTQTASTVYQVLYTPTTDLEGTSSMSIGATKFTDLAGNDNGATASLSALAIDTKIPSIISSSLSWGTSLNATETASNGTITVALTNVENDQTVSFSINSQTYTGTVAFNAATITIPAVRLAALTDGGTYTVTTNVSDAAGNAAPAGTQTFTVDKTVPTISSVSTSAGTIINASESATDATVTVTTTGTENGQVVSVNLNSQTYTGTVSGNSATITIPASALTALADGGTYTITTNVSDAASNAANANTFTITVDKTKPTAAITSSAANLKIGQSATLSITLSEVATDFVAGDMTVTGGTISALTGSGMNYSATFTPTANFEGTAAISIASGSFTDPNANPNDETANTANTISVAVDTKAPTITVSSNPANLRSGQTSVITFTVSESVADFVQSDVSVSGGTLANWTAVSGTSYTADFTPTANSNANGVIDVATTKFTDAAGNTNTAASNTVTISIDNTVPTVAITSSATALKAGETATITFTFSEAVLGFDLTDVSMNNGTFGTLTQTSAAVYEVVFTPTASFEGSSAISIATSRFTDLAGNDNAASASAPSVSIDTQVPTLSISSVSFGTSLNLAEATTNGSVDFALTNVQAGQIVTTTVNSQTYTSTVSGGGTSTLSLPASALTALSNGGTYTITANVSDVAGNAATVATTTFTVDKTSPSLTAVAIVSNNAVTNLAKSGNTITLSITSSETIATPTVTIAGNAATVTGSGTSWTATYAATATTTEGIAAISINFTDLAGNPGTAVTATSNSSSVTVDRTAPAMTISSSASTFKIGTTSTITFTASEATTNFIQSDVSVTGGTLSAWTAVSSTVYRATFTPAVNSAVNGNLSVAGTKFTDASGNANGASNNVSFIIDTFRPTVALTSNVSSLNANETATISFTFNESVSGFTRSDIVATNGTLGSLTGSGSRYSIVFTPAANFNGNASISVASNTFSDTIGNSNTDGADVNNTFTVAIDASAPSVSTATIYSSNVDPTLGNIGDVISIDFVTSETANTPIVTVDGQTAFVSGDGLNWSASYVVINSTNDGVLAFTIDYADLVGNAGPTVTATTDGTSVSVLKNQTPIDNSTPVTYSQDSPDFNLDLLAGISDPEGDPLTVSNVVITYSIENVVTNQPVIINSTTVTKFQDVVSTADLSGTDLFIEMSKSKFLSGSQKGQINIAYVVTDGNNNLNANAVINIIGANDQPAGAAVTLNQVVINGQNMGIPLTEGVGVSTNVPGIDPDDDSVEYTLDQNSSVSNGQFVFNPDGSFNFLPDPNYYGEQEFDYFIKDQSGVLNGPYKVKIVIAENPDIDGIPSKLEEVAPNGGDVNGDGIPDRKQNNITNVPLGSYADYQAGIDWANGVPGVAKPSTSKVGSLLIGSLPGGSSDLDSLDLDPNAKFRNVALLPTPNIANTDRQFSSDLYQFTIEGLLTNAADTLSPRLPLRDLDPNRPGLQVRAVLEFPVGMKGSTYLKKNAAGEWKSFKDDQNLKTYDDGATLIDLDNDPSTIERIVLTFTDGAFGDKDGLVNNTISDPGGLGIIKPVINDATLTSRPEGTVTATLLYNVYDANSLADTDDEGQKLYYTLDSINSAAVRAAVAIDSLTGAITVKEAAGFDYESFVDANGIARFNIVVRATDTDGNYDLASFTQEITNVDEFPRIISGKTVSYREKQPTSVAVIKVQTLPDYQDLTSFNILPGLDGSAFTIDPVTGILRFVKSPNFDDKAVYTLDIQSKDLSGKTDHAVFTINIIDIDADNDGILDDEEIGSDPLHPIDTDQDGIPDYLDTDSDGDGIPDLLETTGDTDKDGIPDYLDTDSDGDGILDKIEAGPNPLKPLDSDGDGIPDYRELDADNDGYLDAYEKDIDTDKDGIPDFQDTDSDGDGILDKVEDDVDFGNLKDCDHDGIENRIDPDVCELILPQIITPNGDGLNDVLKIPGIFRLQPNHLTIINRWGAVVFEQENYQNTWGGNGVSGELPDGNYYYVVDFKGAKPTITNFVYLDRTGK